MITSIPVFARVTWKRAIARSSKRQMTCISCSTTTLSRTNIICSIPTQKHESSLSSPKFRLDQIRWHYFAMREEHEFDNSKDEEQRVSSNDRNEIGEDGRIQVKEELKHCHTCTCEHLSPVYNDLQSSEEFKTEDKESDAFLHSQHSHTCQDNYIDMNLPLPPPLPEPKYSFHRRILPSSLIQFSSPEGRTLFKEALLNEHAEAFFPLAEQFLNQSDPAYCGVTTLIMVLNAIGIDPNVRWKGGWRWYGNEDMILNSCCINSERVRRAGILMEEFQSLGVCQGLEVEMKRPICANTDNSMHVQYTVDDFRKDVIQMVRNPPRYHMDDGHHIVNDNPTGGFMVVSFSRLALDQTGEGHYSPVAAYHEETDRCLVLDVARFKYAPYWVSIHDLYNATKPYDALTRKSRGWFMVYPPHEKFQGTKTMNEAKRDANLIPLASGDIHIRSGNCAIHRK